MTMQAACPAVNPDQSGLEEGRDMSLVERHSITTHGQGEKTMVFVHGYGCDQNIWRLLTPFFTHSHALVLYDQAGAGNSDLGAYDRHKYASLEGYADDLIAICAMLDRGPTIVVAHSVGATIALLAARRRPDLFEKLILVGPSPCYLNDGAYRGGFDQAGLEEILEFLQLNLAGWSAQMAPVIMGNPERPELAAELEASFCRNDPVIAHLFARVTFLSDHRAALAAVTTPALILQSDDDVIAPVAVGTYMHAAMPDAELVILRSAGHCPHVSAPGMVAAAIVDYLAA